MRYIQQRNQYLLAHSDEYFLQKMFDLQSYFDKLFTEAGSEAYQINWGNIDIEQTKRSLLYFGEQHNPFTRKYNKIF